MSTLELTGYLTVAVAILAAWPVWAVWTFYSYRRSDAIAARYHSHYSPRDGAMVPDSYSPYQTCRYCRQGIFLWTDEVWRSVAYEDPVCPANSDTRQHLPIRGM